MRYRVLLVISMVLLGAATAFAAEVAPPLYFSLNPYDEVMLGPRVLLQGKTCTLDLRLGYAAAQQDGRGRFLYRNMRGLGPRVGYELQGFHEVQARSDLAPLSETGFYEGHTGSAFSIFYRLGKREVGTFTLVGDKVWAFAAAGALRSIPSDRIYSLRAGYQHDTRGEFFHPRSGGRVSLSVVQAVRAAGGTRAYLRSAATLARYSGFGDAGALAWRLHVAGTAGTPPPQRQIWLPEEGVRGYGLAANNGTLAAVANTELRLPMLPREQIPIPLFGTLQRLQLTAFADAGTIQTLGGAWRVRGGVGMGIRAPSLAFGQIPVILRLDVAQGVCRGGRLNSYLLLTAPELF